MAGLLGSLRFSWLKLHVSDGSRQDRTALSPGVSAHGAPCVCSGRPVPGGVGTSVAPQPLEWPQMGGVAGRGRSWHLEASVLSHLLQPVTPFFVTEGCPGAGFRWPAGVALPPSWVWVQAEQAGDSRGVNVWESLGLPVCHWQPEGDREATPGLFIGTDGQRGLVSWSRANDCPTAVSEAWCPGSCHASLQL